MNNKIEFTDNANKEIERIILEKGRKTYFHLVSLNVIRVKDLIVLPI